MLFVCDKLNTKVPIFVNAICNDAFRFVMFAVITPSAVCRLPIVAFNPEMLDAVCVKATTDAFTLLKLAVNPLCPVCTAVIEVLIPDILEATCALNIVRLVPFK